MPNATVFAVSVCLRLGKIEGKKTNSASGFDFYRKRPLENDCIHEPEVNSRWLVGCMIQLHLHQVSDDVFR